jgi:hypothetical protein
VFISIECSKLTSTKEKDGVPFMTEDEAPVIDKPHRSAGSASSSSWTQVSGVSVTYSVGKSENLN